jgi:hypothetical protein
MTKEATGAAFTSDLLGGVPGAFIQTALLAGGVGLWEWPVGTDDLALSPYLEPSWVTRPADSTAPRLLSRAAWAARPPALRGCAAEAIDRGAEVDLEFRVSDMHGDCAISQRRAA